MCTTIFFFLNCLLLYMEPDHREVALTGLIGGVGGRGAGGGLGLGLIC
jgi:hypothetical protein